jgi:hypothetical protein
MHAKHITPRASLTCAEHIAQYDVTATENFARAIFDPHLSFEGGFAARFRVTIQPI